MILRKNERIRFFLLNSAMIELFRLFIGRIRGWQKVLLKLINLWQKFLFLGMQIAVVGIYIFQFLRKLNCLLTSQSNV